MKQLSSIFLVDICAYAVMNNHYHVVLRVNQEQAGKLDDVAVARRWKQLFSGHPVVDNWLKDAGSSTALAKEAGSIISQWRERLLDISWFMRCLNEFIARRSNQEEGCKGRFWEGRYRSQALLDEVALLTCMTYVDLNPIRAGLSKGLDASDFTSIQERLLDHAGNDADTAIISKSQRSHIESIVALCEIESVGEIKNVGESGITGISGATGENAAADLNPDCVPHAKLYSLGSTVGKATSNQPIDFSFADYLELLHWTISGLPSGDDSRPRHRHALPSIVTKYAINEEKWQRNVCQYGSRFHYWVGSVAQLRRCASQMSLAWVKGIKSCTELYAPG